MQKLSFSRKDIEKRQLANGKWAAAKEFYTVISVDSYPLGELPKGVVDVTRTTMSEGLEFWNLVYSSKSL